MKDIKKLLVHHNNISLDSCVFIYHFEGSGKYNRLTIDLFKSIENGSTIVNCSTLVLSEVLVLPYKLGKYDAAKEYEFLIKTFPNVNLNPVSSDIAARSAIIRSKYNLPAPDSIHLANALTSGCSLFITNDSKLKKIDEIKVICLEELI